MPAEISWLQPYETTLGVFALVTLFLGGGTAWLTGRAIALTWRPWWQIIVYAFLLGGTVRFLHHALFLGTLLSPRFFLIDTAVCAILAGLAFIVTRMRQKRRQYAFLHRLARK